MEEVFLSYCIFAVGLLLLGWHAYRTDNMRKKKRLQLIRELLVAIRGKQRLSQSEVENMHQLYRKILDVPGRISERECSLLLKVLKLIKKKQAIV